MIAGAVIDVDRRPEMALERLHRCLYVTVLERLEDLGVVLVGRLPETRFVLQ